VTCIRLPNETAKQQELRERHVQLYREFKALIPGFNDIVFTFEGKPDLLQRFADTVSIFVLFFGTHVHYSTSLRITQTPLEVKTSIHVEFVVSITSSRTGIVISSIRRSPSVVPSWSEVFAINRWPSCFVRSMTCNPIFSNPPCEFIFFLSRMLLIYPRDYMDAVIDGKIDVKSYELPSFLYDQTEEYDPDRRHIGLLRGDLVVRVFRHIFTGPGTAMTGISNYSTKGCKAKIHRMTTITPATIAYAATMVMSIFWYWLVAYSLTGSLYDVFHRQLDQTGWQIRS
jgi:hypothetical protein